MPLKTTCLLRNVLTVAKYYALSQAVTFAETADTASAGSPPFDSNEEITIFKQWIKSPLLFLTALLSE